LTLRVLHGRPVVAIASQHGTIEDCTNLKTLTHSEYHPTLAEIHFHELGPQRGFLL